jgi:glutamyl-Q tRNA(Asp) synthetase
MNTYRGRFAPSPTGDLHFGSLIAALASYLFARAANGVWLIRVEDIDTPREVKGAAERIIHTLASFGMTSDEPIVYQSQRLPLYREALSTLQKKGLVFPCACTRRSLEPSGIHRGACTPNTNALISWRLRTPKETLSFVDEIQGSFQQDLAQDVGDFVLQRADGLFTYQLAVVVDDAAQGVTHIVRGADLLDSTPRQMYLQRCLGLSTPSYAHVPLAVDEKGVKLSKQLASAPVDPKDPLPALRRALSFLGQDPHPTCSNVNELLLTAIEHFDVKKIPSTMNK